MTPLRVGFAQCDITPPLGLPLGGYGARIGGADGVLDPLQCRAVFIDDGVAPVAIVALDLVYVFGDWVAGVRRRAAEVLPLRPDRLLIAATHTHAGPAVFRSSIERHDQVASYEVGLSDKVVACLVDAQQSAQPAALRFGSSCVTGIAANRRDPSLPVDETLRVLAAHAPDGALRGVIANFACHPTILSAANHAYSGDLLGVAAAIATQALGAPVAFTNGAAGDVSTRFTRRAQTHAEVQRLGQALADAVGRAVARATPTVSSGVFAATQTVAVRWRPLPEPADAGAHLQAALAALATLRASEADAAAIRVAESRVEGAQAELWVSHQGGWEALFGPRQPFAELQALRCGGVTIVAAPGELFSSAGQWLHDRLGEPSLLVGYANDYLGYVIPEADAAAGGYEALMAMVDPACEMAMRSGLIATAARATREATDERRTAVL